MSNENTKHNEQPAGELDCLLRLVRHFDPPCLLRPEKMKLWGQESTEQVAFCAAICGNGKRLLAVQPLAARPTYYLIRVDDGWGISNWAEGDTIGEHMEEIYEAIEEDFGMLEVENDDGEMIRQPWPALNTDYGSSWWEADPEDYLPNNKDRHKAKQSQPTKENQ